MSWYIKLIGKPADVKAEFQKNESIPQPLKDTVALYADAAQPDSALLVESNGHFYKGSVNSLGNLIISPVQVAPPATVAAAQPDAPATTAT